MAKMTKTAKLKKILSMARYHKEIIVYFGTKYDSPEMFPMRRRKIRANGDSFISYKSSGSLEWSKFGRSCFICEDYPGPKKLDTTIKLMKKHDGNYIFPVAIEVDGRRIEL